LWYVRGLFPQPVELTCRTDLGCTHALSDVAPDRYSPSSAQLLALQQQRRCTCSRRAGRLRSLQCASLAKERPMEGRHSFASFPRGSARLIIQMASCVPLRSVILQMEIQRSEDIDCHPCWCALDGPAQGSTCQRACYASCSEWRNPRSLLALLADDPSTFRDALHGLCACRVRVASEAAVCSAPTLAHSWGA
jgi:hypothetical protein